MGTRRLGMLLLGLWAGVSLSMLFVAAQNFRGVNRLLEAPPPQTSRTFKRVGPDAVRELLRYQVSELNRYYFDTYGALQLALAGLLGLNLVLVTNGRKLMLLLCFALLAISIAQKMVLIPEIADIGRSLDFNPTPDPLMVSRFSAFHAAFSSLELVKMALLATVAGLGLFRRRPARSAAEAPLPRRKYRVRTPVAAAGLSTRTLT